MKYHSWWESIQNWWSWLSLMSLRNRICLSMFLFVMMLLALISRRMNRLEKIWKSSTIPKIIKIDNKKSIFLETLWRKARKIKKKHSFSLKIISNLVSLKFRERWKQEKYLSLFSTPSKVILLLSRYYW